MVGPKAHLQDRQGVQQERAGLRALLRTIEDGREGHAVQGGHDVVVAEGRGMHRHGPAAVLGRLGKVAARERQAPKVVLDRREVGVVEPTDALDDAEGAPMRDAAPVEVAAELADDPEVGQDRGQLEGLRAEAELGASLRLEQVPVGGLEIADLAPHGGARLEGEGDRSIALPRIRQRERVDDGELGLRGGRVGVAELEGDQRHLDRDLDDDRGVVDLPGKGQGLRAQVVGLVESSVVAAQGREADHRPGP